jgi:alpha-galactosidase
MKSALNTLLLAVAQLQAAEALNNGVGLKPHMGWSSWVRDT